MSITIDAEHWPMAAGCIGLAKLYPDKIRYTQAGIKLEEHLLVDLAERYIDGLIKQFSIADRDFNRLQWHYSRAKKDSKNLKKYATEARKNINEQVKKVKKYFPEKREYQLLANIIEELKIIKKEEQLPHFKQIINDYYALMA